MSLTDEIAGCIERLSLLEPCDFPVLTLYLDTRAHEQGRPMSGPYLRKAFEERIESFPPHAAERGSLEADREAIHVHIRERLAPETDTLVVFACSGGGLFETLELKVPIAESEMHVSHVPQLYTLARLLDAYPRYAALVADTNRARIFVFGLRETEVEREISNPKQNRTDMGGWSQQRYQRHVDNFYLQHAKEVVSELERIARQEAIDRVVLAGDEVIVPLLRQQMSKDLAAKVVDVLALDIRTPLHAVLESSLASMRAEDERSDEERVTELLDEYRSGGLAVAGRRDTLAALQLGQAYEVLLPGTVGEGGDGAERAGRKVDRVLANEVVREARRTDARLRFIEDDDALSPVGGIAAFLRYRLAPDRATIAGVR